MSQQTITFKAPAELDARLVSCAAEQDRPKSYIVRQALKIYLEDRDDYLIAIKRLEESNPEARVSLEELEREFGLNV